MAIGAPSSALPVLLTEASLRETAAHAVVAPLHDLAVELRPLGVADVEANGLPSASSTLARRAFNARAAGDMDRALL